MAGLLGLQQTDRTRHRRPRNAPRRRFIWLLFAAFDARRAALSVALVAGHDVIFLGERRQAKRRMIRSLVGLLDEWLPIVPGSEINDDPCCPVSQRARDLVAEGVATSPTSSRCTAGSCRGPNAGSSPSTSCRTPLSASRSDCPTCSRGGTSRFAVTKYACPSTSCAWPRQIRRTSGPSRRSWPRSPNSTGVESSSQPRHTRRLSPCRVHGEPKAACTKALPGV